MAKQFRARHIIFTEFNYGEDPEAYLKQLSKSADYVIGQLEKCPKTDKLHIQGFAHTKEISRWGFMKCHKEPAKEPLKAIEYCSKLETRIEGPFEFGIKPTFNIKGQKLKNMQIINGSITQLIEEERVPLLQIKKLIEAKNLYNVIKKNELKPLEDKGKKKGYWHYGPPRTGKSTAARTGTYYLKMANKWWDGYNGEDKVVLEDVDKSMKDWLGYFIKIWTDWWPFKGEIKGSIIDISIKEFHVTSNYTIGEIWDDAILAEAIDSRFELINYK